MNMNTRDERWGRNKQLTKEASESANFCSFFIKQLDLEAQISECIERFFEGCLFMMYLNFVAHENIFEELDVI